jgi:glucans biosynthesis protein
MPFTQALAEPFSAEVVRQLAASLATRSFAQPAEVPSPKVAGLSYDQFRDVRFKPERAVWRGEKLGFELHLLPVGWLFKHPVTLHVVDGGTARRIEPSAGYFDFGKLAAQAADAEVGFSGFRLNGFINRPDKMDEIVVFQGASYFRAVSQGQGYGLSARGLAVDTGEPKGEEFPFFRSFWIEKPAAGADEVIIHALLDSPSATGAYRFRVRAGAPTVTEIEATLYPRRTLDRVGLAPLTSMFLFSPADPRLLDYRAAVHDSDGLAIVDGDGERVWRPLANPKRLQFSAFAVENPKGFGLVQRSRQAADFQDLEARYDKRPTGWIEPIGSWGHGNIVLIEIPTDEEIHDNIVAFWRPAAPLEAGKPFTIAYRLSWPNDVPANTAARVERTAIGPAIGPLRKQGLVQFVVDFSQSAATADELPTAHLVASAGRVLPPVVQANPATGGTRVSFLLDPKGIDLSELRLVLRRGENELSEVWLYRWIK